MIKRAVVIDDDQAIRSVISSILKRRGYEVHASTEPLSCPIFLHHECQCQIEHACTNILITDVNMPNMTGLEFIKNQKINGCKVQNIAVISAAWQESDLKLAKNLGYKIFKKPFKINELNKWLDECERNTDPNIKLSNLPGKTE